ncbi:hypothetical protein ES703_37679 [subsurface metagenome]
MNQENLAERFNSWMETSGWILPKCPISKGRHWLVAEHIVEFRPYARAALVAGGSVYPAVMIICQDCGYTMFVNAALTGLVE